MGLRQMNRIIFENLSDAEIDFLADGCGVSGTPLNAPDFLSTDSCNRHDVGYWIGGASEDRKAVDLEFYKNMRKDSHRLGGWWGRAYRALIARTYYASVRIFAGFRFHYGTKRTLDDLAVAIEEDRNAKI